MKYSKRLVSDFERYLQGLNYAPSTISKRLRCIKRFLAYINDKGIDPLSVGWRDIEVYQARIIADVSPATAENIMTAVRGFYRSLRDQGRVVDMPTEMVPLPRRPRILPRNVPTRAEMRRLLRVPDTDTDRGVLYRAILELAYSTGMRRAEICKLQMQDIDLAGGSAAVRQGKFSKDRCIPVGCAASGWLARYMETVRPSLLSRSGKPESTVVFLGSLNGRPIDPNYLSHIFTSLVKKARLKRNITFHGLRHAFATHMIQRGADLADVRQMMGHEFISTTQRYVQLTATDVIRAHRRYHPREQQEEVRNEEQDIIEGVL